MTNSETQRWLDWAYPASPHRDERFHIGVLGVGGTWSGTTYSRDQVAAAVAEAERKRPQGVYLGACTYRPEAGHSRKAIDTAWCYGMWSDLDIAGPGHKHDPAKHNGLTLPPDEESARKIVATSGLPEPTAWVHSGGGLYAWWMFDQPMPAAECGAMSRQTQALLARAAATLGWHYGTGVSDLARVLRLPGTVNRKEGLARPCVVLSARGPRYPPQAFGAHVVALTPTPEPTTTAATANPSVEAFFSAPNGSSSDALGAFNRATDWRRILEPYGWQYHYRHDDGTDYWVRPGKDPNEGHSATTGHTVADTMKCFSDSAGLPMDGTMTKAFVWAALTQGTPTPDMQLAAAQLGQIGYGQAGERAADTVMAFELSGMQPAAVTGRQLKVTRASEITMRAVRWLWEEEVEQTAVARYMCPIPPAKWLPLGGLCLLGGREGIGKTTWAYRIAAQATTGTLPGSFLGQPRSVVVAATEDDWARTIVPRLVAAGSDLERVIRVDAEEDGYISGLTLPADVAALRRLCEHEDVALVLLDPLMGTISGVLDTHKDAEVRRALEPLSRLAHDGQMTVLGLIHVNKSQGSDLLTRLMASRAFSAVARTVLFATKEEPEPGAEQPQHETFLFGQAKNNLAAKVPHSVKYHIDGMKVGYDEELGEDIRSSYIVVDGTTDGRIDEIISAQENRAAPRETVSDRAEKWLREYLAGKGAVPSETVKEDGADAGFNARTLQRLLVDVGVLVTPLPGTNNKTAWTLRAPIRAVATDTLVTTDTLVATVADIQNGMNRGVATVATSVKAPARAVATPVAEVSAGSETGRCCGSRAAAGAPLVNACKLCSKSPTFWRGQTPAHIAPADPNHCPRCQKRLPDAAWSPCDQCDTPTHARGRGGHGPTCQSCLNERTTP